MPERAALERRTTELLQRLIRFNTVNPPGNEGPAQEWLKGLLEEAGLDCALLEAVPGRPNLVARLGAAGDGPALCLLGHVDTVPADPGDWQVDPWSGELRDDCVWGRGAKDMKSQVAAELAATLALVEEGWRPEAGELKLVFTCDEERGATHGAQWLCSDHPDEVRADFVVNEGAGELIRHGDRRVYGVCVGEKGVFRFTLSTSGRAGHASVPRIGENALVKMAPVLSALGRRQARPHRLPRGGGAPRSARPRPLGPRCRGRRARGERPGRRRAARADAGRDADADHDRRLDRGQRRTRARAARGGLPGSAGAR